MELTVAEGCLVLLAGAAGSGKSTFAARHFHAHEIVSSDHCRELVAGDAADQAATGSAFSLLDVVLDKRLRRGLLTVVDATNTAPRHRRRLAGVARRHGRSAVAVVLDLPLAVCRQRNAARAGRRVPDDALATQHEQLRAGLDRLAAEGFAAVHLLTDVAAVDAATVRRVPPQALAAGRAATTAAPPPRRQALLVDTDSVALTGELLVLLAALAGRLDVVVTSARAGERDALSARLDDAGVACDALLVARRRQVARDDDLGATARRLLADDVVGVWRPTLGITADPAVAAAWREAGVAMLVAPER